MRESREGKLVLTDLGLKMGTLVSNGYAFTYDIDYVKILDEKTAIGVSDEELKKMSFEEFERRLNEDDFEKLIF